MPPQIPQTEVMLGWIREVFSRGIRRPGYEADRWAEGFIRERFVEFGLRDVRFEPVESPYWCDASVGLAITGANETPIPCSAVPFTRPGSIAAPLGVYDPADPGSVAGKIAIFEVKFTALPIEFPVMARVAGGATVSEDPDDPASSGWVFDPDQTFRGAGHRVPFPLEIMNSTQPAIDAGALGFIGILRNYSGGTDYYVPYDGEMRPIPGVYVDESTGDQLIELARRSGATARISLEAETGSVTCNNVVGELTGADDEMVVVGTHHDGPWSSAVEDASGISLLLAQAQFWSQVEVADRPHRILFTANASHMAGGRGTQTFIETHRPEIDQIVLEIHLEHAARETELRNGTEVVTEMSAPRWWFTSEIPELERTVWKAIRDEGLDRSLILTPTAIGPRPTTDGGFFHEVGVPIVNYLTAPWYLFDREDILEKIHEPTLEALTRATVSIINSTKGVSAKGMRMSTRQP